MDTRVLRWMVAVTAVVAIGLLGTGAAVASEGGRITGKVTTPSGRFLRETVVHLVKVPGHYRPKTLVMTQHHLHFHPHVLAITFGDTVKYVNRDPVDHNVYSTDHEGFNLGVWGFGQSRSYTYDKAHGAYAEKCDLHPDMLAYVFVNQNPYEAVVDRAGHYTLTGVPPGTYQLAVWNSHFHAAPEKVTVHAGGTVTRDFTLQGPARS